VYMIDECAGLSSINVRRGMEQELREALIAFVTTGSCAKWLGPKKSRLIVSYLMGNKNTHPDTQPIVDKFFAWLFDPVVEKNDI